MKQLQLVTKEWFAAKIAANPSNTIGRALVALFKEQTQEERSDNITKFRNGVGFAKPDARVGTIAAKTFIKNGKLEDWQLRVWMKPNKQNLPRIVKYAEQLNSIANRKLVKQYEYPVNNDFYR